MSNKITFIIQARLASTRMPAKIIRPFYEQRSIIQLLLDKLKQFSSCQIVLATSIEKTNDPLEQIAKEANVICFRGSENDVLQRFIDAAENVGTSRIIRVCSDNPLLNEQAIEQLMTTAEKSQADYISFMVNGTPSIKTHFGFWTEYVTLEALKKVKLLTDESIYHEHVTNFIYAHPDLFNIQWLNTPACIQGRNDIRLTCDTPIDFQNAQAVYAALISKQSHPTIEEIVEYIDAHQEFLKSMQQEIIHNSK